MSGGQQKQSSSSQSTSYIPAQKEGIGQAIQTYMPTMGAGQPVYQGNRVAGFSPLQEQVFQLATPQNLFMTPEQAETYFQDVIATPTMNAFEEDTAPAIREEYSGPGYWSSARAKAVGDARTDMAGVLSGQRQQVLQGAREQNANVLPQMYGYGEAQQQYEQAQINALIDKFIEEQRLTDPENLATLLSLFGISMNQATSKSSGSGWNIGDIF